MNFTFKDNKGKLTGLVGAGCCAVLLSYVPAFEGVILRGYKDPIGIVTACVGHTKTAVLGKPYTQEQCQELLINDLTDKAEQVKKCVKVPLTTGQLAASISFAFNVGTTRFCNSQVAKEFNAKRYMEGCAQMSRWVYAGDRILPGLVERRKIERRMCEGKIT